MAYEGLIGNKNAEKWTLENSIELFNKAIVLANNKEIIVLKKGEFSYDYECYQFDFIGEVAREMKLYKSIFTEIVEKFPQLKWLHTQLVETLEANCFCNSKKGAIKEATAIVNLKANHMWKDRQETIHSGEINSKTSITVESTDQADKIKKIIEGLNNDK
jgi:hypothetical protein